MLDTVTTRGDGEELGPMPFGYGAYVDLTGGVPLPQRKFMDYPSI